MELAVLPVFGGGAGVRSLHFVKSEGTLDDGDLVGFRCGVGHGEIPFSGWWLIHLLNSGWLVWCPSVTSSVAKSLGSSISTVWAAAACLWATTTASMGSVASTKA